MCNASRVPISPRRNRTLYALLPEGTAPKATATSESGSDELFRSFDLPNGLRLLVKENHRLPFVEFRAAFQGGVLAENSRNNGVTQLMAKTLIKGRSAAARRTSRARLNQWREHRYVWRQPKFRGECRV